MKIKLFEEYEDIDFICKKYGIRNYTIRDGVVDVDGRVDLSGKKLDKLPLHFGIVRGDFSCFTNKLTTLQGAPQEVGGDFSCFNNRLTTLQGAPQEVGGYFDCTHNNLISLMGAPKQVGGYFDCKYNKLTSLQGAPDYVGGTFACSGNKLTSLQGAPKIGGNFYYDYNPLPKEILDFEDIKYILKWQDEYSIWRRDGSIDLFRFQEMIKDYD